MSKFLIGAIIVLLIALGLSVRQVYLYKEEAKVQKMNVSALMQSVQEYRVQDSLKAASVSELQLTLKQYEQYRQEDAEIINSLKVDKNRLQSIITTQTDTYYAGTAALRDSIRKIINQSGQIIEQPIKVAEIENKWHNLNVVLSDSLEYQLKCYEELIVVNHIIPKRFLWIFKFGVKDIKTEVVSKNPYTKKISVESVTIRD